MPGDGRSVRNAAKFLAVLSPVNALFANFPICFSGHALRRALPETVFRAKVPRKIDKGILQRMKKSVHLFYIAMCQQNVTFLIFFACDARRRR